MPVTVYPRLGEVLRGRNLTVAELERQIEQRYGVPVDRKTLHRLTYPEPIERVDLEVTGAVAAVLGVDLGELFEVEAVAVGTGDGVEAGELSADESRRLSELFDQAARRALREGEQAELRSLVDKYGQLLRERVLRGRAQRERVLVEEARARTDAELARMLSWWARVAGNEAWRRRLSSRVRGRRTRRGAA